MDYRVRKKLWDRVVDTLMILLLIGTLFPIGWMIFCSFKDNNEILKGQVTLGRWENNPRVLYLENNFLWVGTTDGCITKFRTDAWQQVGHHHYGTLAVNFAFASKEIWISSANKGLLLVDKNNLQLKNHFEFNWDVFLTDVSASFLVVDGNSIWYGIWGREPQELAVFDIANNEFQSVEPKSGRITKLSVTALAADVDRLYIGTANGLVIYDKQSNELEPVSEPLSVRITVLTVGKDGNVWVGTSNGLYQFDPTVRQVKAAITMDQGLLSNQILCLYEHDGLLWIGHSAGLSRYDLSQKQVTNYVNLFQPVDLEGSPISNGLIPKEVLAIGGNRRWLALGTTQGRVSIFELKSMQPVKQLILPKGRLRFRWRNYIDLWRRINFGLYFRNSMIVCGSVMFIAMLLASLSAYALSRFKFPGSGLFNNSILATQMIPGIMFLIPIFLMFRKFHVVTGIPVIGTFPGLIFTYSAFFVPFSIWILRGFFASIPVELEEAAYIDGCSTLLAFFKIVLPLAMPGIVATGIYVFLTAWDELMFAWILTSADTMTIPVGIRTFIGNYQNRYDLMMAAATVSTLPVVLMFFLMQRRIVQGLTAGAVKH